MRFEQESRRPVRNELHAAARLAKHVSLLQSDLSELRAHVRETQSRSTRDQEQLQKALQGQKDWNLGLARDLNQERQARLDLEDVRTGEQQSLQQLLIAREEAQEDGQQLRGACDALSQRIDLLAQEIIATQKREQSALAEAEQLRDELTDARDELRDAKVRISKLEAARGRRVSQELAEVSEASRGAPASLPEASRGAPTSLPPPRSRGI
eukprot:Hpha_TRINITY_DN5126_c0_g1::TRINITY_DN5126_c0_g1_i1::g.193128::m.193128